MDISGDVKRFDGAVTLLPYGLREKLRELNREERAEAEEFRLRRGKAVSVVFPGGERSLGGQEVSQGDLDFLLEVASAASVHTVRSKLSSGYITARGGYRVGFAGSAALEGGRVSAVSNISSAAVRIAREKRGIAEGVFFPEDFSSALIISPPGGGKTTLLRDAVRLLSSGKGGLRVSLCDERGEIAAMCGGAPQLDVGDRTDVLDGWPKAEAITAALRALSPEVIALDEITSPEDCDAVLAASHCGVGLLATAHGLSLEDLGKRPVYKRLLENGIFRELVTITTVGGRRLYGKSRL